MQGVAYPLTVFGRSPKITGSWRWRPPGNGPTSPHRATGWTTSEATVTIEANQLEREP
jgi:hypothetical protein